MSIIPYSSIHNLKSLQPQHEVKEDSIAVKFFNPNDEGILLYIEGLNPCLGIVVTGEVTFADADDDEDFLTQHFVVMNHNSGPTPADLSVQDGQTKLQNFCNDEITKMIAEIENTFSGKQLYKIHIKNSYFIRCKQTEAVNPQQQVSQSFTDILANDFSEMLETEGAVSDNVIIEFADDYTLFKHEPLEKLRVNNESDAIHIFLQNTARDGLSLMYYKGFKTLEELKTPIIAGDNARIFHKRKTISSKLQEEEQSSEEDIVKPSEKKQKAK